MAEQNENIYTKCITQSWFRTTSKIPHEGISQVFAGTLLRLNKKNRLGIVQVLQDNNIFMIFKDFGNYFEFFAYPETKVGCSKAG